MKVEIDLNGLESSNTNDSTAAVEHKSDEKVAVFVDGKKKSSIGMSFFNFANSILGTGIIFLPDAIKKSGPALGFILAFLSAIITAYTCYLLVISAKKYKITSYSELVKKVLGQKAYIFAAFCNLLLPFLMCVTYGVVSSDNMVLVFQHLSPNSTLFINKIFIRFLVLIIIAMPLSLPKHISILEHISTLSIIFVIFYASVFMYKTPQMIKTTLALPEFWNFARSGIPQALSTLFLAFSAHHNILIFYKTLHRNTIARFSIVIYVSVGFSAIVYYAVIISGYLSFATTINGNLISSYCVKDYLIIFTRVIFSLSIIFTLPLNAISARTIIMELFDGYLENNRSIRYRVTIIMFACIYAISIIPISVTSIVQFVGAVTASPLVMIFPCLLYFKAIEHPFYKLSLTSVVLWTLIGLGVTLTLIGGTMAILEAIPIFAQ
ncbi:hypothetical protein HZS_7172, partial [Henneguya salminicola]